MDARSKDGSRLKMLMAMLLGVLVAFVMTAAMTSEAYARGYGEVVDGDYTFQVYFDDTENEAHSVFISKYSGSDTQLIVPTMISKNASYTEHGTTTKEAVGDVVVGEVMIGDSAFENNAKLEKIALPSGVEGIGSRAFAGCSNLTEVAIGGPVYEWGFNFSSDAFVDCPNLKTYYIADGSYNGIANSGIGQAKDSEGNYTIYAGVIVYTDAAAGSDIVTAIDAINAAAKAKDPNANQITVKYLANPYANNTVKPTVGDTGGNGDDDKPLTIDPTKQMGADNTAYGKGAAAEAAEAAITKYAKEADPKGTVFNLLQAKVKKVTKSAIALTWKKPSGTKKFVIYGNKCGKTNKQVKLATTTKTTYKFSKKLNKKVPIKKGTYYKFTIVALDKNKKVVSTSKIIHVATPGGKYTNDKKVTTAAKKNAVSLKKGKTFKLKAKAVAIDKKLKRASHRKVAYESDKTAIATVDKKGVIKAKKKGTCHVYAYAQNGVCTKVTVTVK